MSTTTNDDDAKHAASPPPPTPPPTPPSAVQPDNPVSHEVLRGRKALEDYNLLGIEQLKELAVADEFPLLFVAGSYMSSRTACDRWWSRVGLKELSVSYSVVAMNAAPPKRPAS